MFNPNTHQFNFAPRSDCSMPHSLQVNAKNPSYLSDNRTAITSANGPACFTDGPCLFSNPHRTCGADFAKAGLYNLRPRGSACSSISDLPSAPAKFKKSKDAATPPPVKAKRQRNSLKKRLLVNARERDRMRVLNNGFQALRDALPCYIADGHMAKITTLRLAINYIKALNEVLNEDVPSIPPKRHCQTTPLQHPPSNLSSNSCSMIQQIPNQSNHFKQVLPPINVSLTEDTTH